MMIGKLLVFCKLNVTVPLPLLFKKVLVVVTEIWPIAKWLARENIDPISNPSFRSDFFMMFN
jgi:hypothetical protein